MTSGEHMYTLLTYFKKHKEGKEKALFGKILCYYNSKGGLHQLQLALSLNVYLEILLQQNIRPSFNLKGLILNLTLK